LFLLAYGFYLSPKSNLNAAALADSR